MDEMVFSPVDCHDAQQQNQFHEVIMNEQMTFKQPEKRELKQENRRLINCTAKEMEIKQREK
jgi:hypothetical protein